VEAEVKKTGREVLYTETGRYNEPTVAIAAGEQVLVQTELCSGSWLQTKEDVWSPEKSRGPNPSSGCIRVEGAGPGDMLAVRIETIDVIGVGYTGFGPGMNPFPDWIRGREWGIVTRTVEIRDGFVEWSDDLKIPIRPMVGFLGTAPATGSYPNSHNGTYGGNLDVQEACAGSTVYLPVYVEGALLHVGDVHAIQGDGEICCGGGIETRADVVLTVDVMPRPAEMTWPRIRTATHVATVGCARPAEDAFRIGVQEMVRWIHASRGMDERDAVLLLGQVLQARCTQFVNPRYTYICKVDTRFLPGI